MLIELCAGSAAITRSMCGLGPLVGFMGAKDRYCDQILCEWDLAAQDKILLNDPGVWGDIWTAISLGMSGEVAQTLELWAAKEARGLYYSLKSFRPSGPAEAAAAGLCLIAGTFGGGEVGGFKGRHRHRPNVDGFIPSRSTLASRVSACVPTGITVTRTMAQSLNPLDFERSWVYIDPPYDGHTGYRNKLSRAELLKLASGWRDAGHHVAVSEAVPLTQELGPGWKAVEIFECKGSHRRNSRQTTEFLTISL